MDDIPRDRQLLPASVDYRAKRTPEKPFALLPKGATLEDGWHTLTYRAFAKAIDATSWWLDEVLGDKASPQSNGSVPYIGESDWRYVLLVFAAAKTGRTMLYPFPANTSESLASLLKSTKSEIVLADSANLEIWKEAREIVKMETPVIQVPKIQHFINDYDTRPYPFTNTYDEGLYRPFLMIQTSGTTGDAKPIIYSTKLMETNMTDVVRTSRTSPPDRKTALVECYEHSYVPNFLPMSWAAGLVMNAFWPLYVETCVPVILPVTPLSPQFVAKTLELCPRPPSGGKTGLLMIPDILRALLRTPELQASLKRADWVAYVGAPLDYPTGDAIAEIVPRVQSFIGSTDTGLYPLLLNDPADWKVHRFREFDGFYLKHFVDDTYELRIKRQPMDPRHVFAVDPELMDCGTRDLWRAVPGRKGYFTNAGRVDDFVKLSSMTKFNAIQIEQHIGASDNIGCSLVAGDDRPKSFAIIETSARIIDELGMAAQEEIVKHIWPAIEAANEHLLPEARISKELTLIADAKRPIKRTAKGTVDRRSTIKRYGAEIEAMYVKAGFAAQSSDMVNAFY